MRIVVADTGPLNYLVLMDDRAGVAAARERVLRAIGALEPAVLIFYLISGSNNSRVPSGMEGDSIIL
jgi:hypothetical protein